MPSLRQLVARIDLDEAMRRRAVQESVTAATAEYWRRRAEAFGAVGNPRCDEVAAACLNRARFLEEFADEGDGDD